MRGVAIGIAIATILFLVTAGHLLFLLIPLGFFLLLRNRPTWEPISRPYPPRAGRPGPAGHE